jgi:hypothetical protein
VNALCIYIEGLGGHGQNIIDLKVRKKRKKEKKKRVPSEPQRKDPLSNTRLTKVKSRPDPPGRLDELNYVGPILLRGLCFRTLNINVCCL